MAAIQRMGRKPKRHIVIPNFIEGICESFALFDSIKNEDNIKLNHLFSKGYNMEKTNIDGYTPLIYAASLGREEIVKDLCLWSVDVNACDNKGKTALHYSSAYNHPAVTRALLDGRADINCKDNKKNTPLHYAVSMGHVPVVRVLLRAGASLTSRNKSNQTPGKIAKDKKTGSPEIRDLIRDEKRKRKDQQSKMNKTHKGLKNNEPIFKPYRNYDPLPCTEKFQDDPNTYEEIDGRSNQETSNQEEDALSAWQDTQTRQLFPTALSQHMTAQQSLQIFKSLPEKIENSLLLRANSTTPSIIRESTLPLPQTSVSLNSESTSDQINMSPPRPLPRDDSRVFGLVSTLQTEPESRYGNTEKTRQSSKSMATSPSEPLLNFENKKDNFPNFGLPNKSPSEPILAFEIAETNSQTTGPMTTSLPKTASETASMLRAQSLDTTEMVETPILCVLHTKNQQEQVDNMRVVLQLLSGPGLRFVSPTSPLTPSNTTASPAAVTRPADETDFRPNEISRQSVHATLSSEMSSDEHLLTPAQTIKYSCGASKRASSADCAMVDSGGAHSLGQQLGLYMPLYMVGAVGIPTALSPLGAQLAFPQTINSHELPPPLPVRNPPQTSVQDKLITVSNGGQNKPTLTSSEFLTENSTQERSFLSSARKQGTQTEISASQNSGCSSTSKYAPRSDDEYVQLGPQNHSNITESLLLVSDPQQPMQRSDVSSPTGASMRNGDSSMKPSNTDFRSLWESPTVKKPMHEQQAPSDEGMQQQSDFPMQMHHYTSMENMYKDCNIYFLDSKNVGINSKMNLYKRDDRDRSSDSGQALTDCFRACSSNS